jgi:hypothetical protein
MDAEALTNKCKHEPTLANYLRLAMLYKQKLHYFKAEKTMAEALERVQASDPIQPWDSEFSIRMASESSAIIPEFSPSEPILYRTSFYIYSTLGDIQMLNRKI